MRYQREMRNHHPSRIISMPENQRTSFVTRNDEHYSPLKSMSRLRCLGVCLGGDTIGVRQLKFDRHVLSFSNRRTARERLPISLGTGTLRLGCMLYAQTIFFIFNDAFRRGDCSNKYKTTWRHLLTLKETPFPLSLKKCGDKYLPVKSLNNVKSANEIIVSHSGATRWHLPYRLLEIVEKR